MNGRPWTETEMLLLKRWYQQGVSCQHIGELLGHNASSVKQKADKLKLRRAVARFDWTPAAEQIVRDRYASTPSAELAAEIGCPVSSVHKKAMKLGIAKDRECVVAMARARMTPDHPGRKHGFKKGIVPWNTGKKITLPEKCKATQFKPGQRPHTTLPIGTTRVSPDGYLEVKFSDVPGSHYKRWVPVHRRVWTDEHGPVPAGHVVAFKPGRRTTDPALITLDAVELITLKENMARNTIHARLPPELRKVAQLRGVLQRVINRKSKESDHEHHA